MELPYNSSPIITNLLNPLPLQLHTVRSLLPPVRCPSPGPSPHPGKTMQEFRNVGASTILDFYLVSYTIRLTYPQSPILILEGLYVRIEGRTQVPGFRGLGLGLRVSGLGGFKF